MVQNPETQYRELIAGTFTQGVWGPQALLVAAAYADASDARYVQTYLNPTLWWRRVQVSSTIEWYAPLERAGTPQLDVNPLTVLVPVHGRIALGPVVTLSFAEGARARHRAGAAVEWTAGWGSLRLELLDRTVGDAAELRTGVVAGF
jgi:hypothetical protein